MVAFQASYWALEAVLGYVQLMREGMAGRQGSRTQGKERVQQGFVG
jgi:hypothetical protein